MRARIAGHLIEANQSAAAVPFMIQAARDAEDRFACTEAGAWHHRAGLQLSGEASAAHLLLAINRYEDAHRPAEAATACYQLLSHPSRASTALSDTQIQCRLALNLIRRGSIKAALQVIQVIAANLDRRWIPLNVAELERPQRNHSASKKLPSSISGFRTVYRRWSPTAIPATSAALPNCLTLAYRCTDRCRPLTTAVRLPCWARCSHRHAGATRKGVVSRRSSRA